MGETLPSWDKGKRISARRIGFGDLSTIGAKGKKSELLIRLLGRRAARRGGRALEVMAGENILLSRGLGGERLVRI